MPTPIATAGEPEAQDTRGNLQEKLTQKFNQVLKNLGTQTLMAVNDAISKDPAYASQPKEQDPEVRIGVLSYIMTLITGLYRPGSYRQLW